jgi:hypothetical protein
MRSHIPSLLFLMVLLLIILGPKKMTVFLKGSQLWRYVTGDIPKPVPRPVTNSDGFDGDSVAYAVIPVDDFKA